MQAGRALENGVLPQPADEALQRAALAPRGLVEHAVRADDQWELARLREPRGLPQVKAPESVNVHHGRREPVEGGIQRS